MCTLSITSWMFMGAIFLLYIPFKIFVFNDVWQEILEYFDIKIFNNPYYMLLQNSTLIVVLTYSIYKTVKNRRLIRSKKIWLKNQIYQQLHSKEFKILSKMIESDYLEILAFEWVDRLGESVQVRNCHRVTRNYFKNSGAFIKKMKRKIRKKLREIDFKAFNSHLNNFTSRNKKFNVFDNDDLISPTLNMQPDPENFFGRNNNIFNLNFENEPDNERIDVITEEEDYPELFEEPFANPDNIFSDNRRNPAMPKILLSSKTNKLQIPKLEFKKIEDLEKMTIKNQFLKLYEEINMISLAIESKLQFLKLDLYRKFTEIEFEEYSKRKLKIQKKIINLDSNIKNSFGSGKFQKNKEFESEKETLGSRKNRNGCNSKEKKKNKKKTRTGK